MKTSGKCSQLCSQLASGGNFTKSYLLLVRAKHLALQNRDIWVNRSGGTAVPQALRNVSAMRHDSHQIRSSSNMAIGSIAATEVLCGFKTINSRHQAGRHSHWIQTAHYAEGLV